MLCLILWISRKNFLVITASGGSCEHHSVHLSCAQIRAKLQAMSEKRRYEEQLRRVKTLGDEDEDGDDIMAWVNKSRFLEQVPYEL